MEKTVRIIYNDYNADYTIASFDLPFHFAELKGSTGVDEERFPLLIRFVYDNGKAIASSDVISIAREIIKQMNRKNSFEFQSNH